MTAIEVLQKAFGESITPVFSEGMDKNVSDLIKYTNFVSVRKNQSNECINFLKKTNVTNLCVNSLYKTKSYTGAQKSHKLNITK